MGGSKKLTIIEARASSTTKPRPTHQPNTIEICTKHAHVHYDSNGNTAMGRGAIELALIAVSQTQSYWITIHTSIRPPPPLPVCPSRQVNCLRCVFVLHFYTVTKLPLDEQCSMHFSQLNEKRMQDDYMHEKNRKVIKVKNTYYKWVFRMSPIGYPVPTDSLHTYSLLLSSQSVDRSID